MAKGLLGDRWRGALLLALIALVSALALAACGGGSSSSSSGGATESEEAPAEEGSAEEASSEEGESEGGSSEVVANAEKIAKPFFEAPKSIGITEPLKAKPESGKKIVAMACELVVCEAWTKYVKEAASKIGWTTKISLFSGAPEDNLNKISAAVSEHPDAIILNGVSRETYEAAAEQAAKENVPIVTQEGELEGKEEEPFVAIQLGAKQFDVMSEATANWFIMDSGGTGSALTVAYAQFPLSERITDTTTETIEKDCPECSVKKILVQAEDTGTKLPAQIVSELQREPSINYVIFQDASMVAGVEAAVREAGLQEKVKLMANNTTPESIKAVEEGAMLGNMSFSQKAAAFQGVDAAARYLEGMSTKENTEAPLMNQIFTTENLPPNSTEEVTNNLPVDLVEQYEKLWLVK
jgi:ribose transport system substrate-binding protein